MLPYQPFLNRQARRAMHQLQQQGYPVQQMVGFQQPIQQGITPANYQQLNYQQGLVPNNFQQPPIQQQPAQQAVQQQEAVEGAVGNETVVDALTDRVRHFREQSETNRGLYDNAVVEVEGLRARNRELEAMNTTKDATIAGLRQQLETARHLEAANFQRIIQRGMVAEVHAQLATAFAAPQVAGAIAEYSRQIDNFDANL